MELIYKTFQADQGLNCGFLLPTAISLHFNGFWWNIISESPIIQVRAEQVAADDLRLEKSVVWIFLIAVVLFQMCLSGFKHQNELLQRGGFEFLKRIYIEKSDFR